MQKKIQVADLTSEDKSRAKGKSFFLNDIIDTPKKFDLPKPHRGPPCDSFVVRVDANKIKNPDPPSLDISGILAILREKNAKYFEIKKSEGTGRNCDVNGCRERVKIIFFSL